jgi:hypothetical protein
VATEPDIDALVDAAVERHLARRAAAQPQRHVVFDQTFSGPKTGRRDAAAALRSAGFDVRDIDCPYGDHAPAAEGETDTDRAGRVRAEQALAWLVAERGTGTVPDGDDQQTLMGRAEQAASRYGFELRMHAVAFTWREGGTGGR